MRKLFFLALILGSIYILHTYYGDSFCQLVDIDVTNPETNKKMLYYTLIFAIIGFCTYQILCKIEEGKKEGFDVIIGDKLNDRVNAINLENFFQFMEYYQAQDLDEQARPMEASCYREGEIVKIRNAIMSIHQMLSYIVNVNKKDNFYSRWMVAKMASNMEWDEMHPKRRLNFDEIVRGNIGKEFTIAPQNDLDLYWPRANMDSKYQNPLPNTINVHDYYTGMNYEVNLLTLKDILERVQEDNPDLFKDIIRPTEHSVFQQEFFAPLQNIIHSMLTIVMTDRYKEYLVKHKFDLRYGSLKVNPDMIRDQFGTY